ncbi:dimethylaniline monooxygenase (N-oxide forming) [Byssothecium circinans]|uniref:Dimethylaniline monooxygenase (N-oxide forming) n=1 Tax=Byssothecium circinans TaxID=147558 RepID=A0A6A5U8F3_9PLEO|nr:dimethylaniline monooxygenase (N-oxide forming) [Byssothecium circinans]
MEEFDVVVVGAGWYGLAAAKTYLELHPHDDIAVLEAAPSAGGVWSRERLYPGLRSNNVLGSYEYSDFPMDPAVFEVSRGEHIPGAVLHRYLTAYAQHFGVYPRIRFNTRVDAAEENAESGLWALSVTNTETGSRSRLQAKKVIIATGLTSDPNLPALAGRDDFGAPIFHVKDFAAHADSVRTTKQVAVLGGAKSAWDVAYAYATAGVTVDMIIRQSGRGPVWMSPAYVTPLKKLLEKLVNVRFLQWFSPCIWGDEDGYGRIRSFYHGTWLGRKMTDAFWAILGGDVLSLVGFDQHPEMKKLKPWHPAFWVGSGLGILNYPTDFFDLVRNGTIRVHVGDIANLSDHTIHLTTGEAIKADALLCATGWKARPPINFSPPDCLADLGMPHHSAKQDPLVEKADSVILAKLPRLKDQPNITKAEQTDSTAPNQPFRLYRFIVPPSSLAKRNIAFAGMTTTISTVVCAQAQALWISAYFDGKLDRLLPPDEARWEAVLHSRFVKWRYPLGYGDRLPDFVFDAIPYVDMLLHDLGVESRRKKSLWAHWTHPYGPEDYKGIVGEWAESHRSS